MSQYTSWRKTARPENLRLIGFYGTYLMGQFSGMGEALNLQAVQAAFEIECIPREYWPDLSQRLLFLHGQVVSRSKKEIS